jgi:hypothetical protein
MPAKINRRIKFLCYFGSEADAQAFGDEPQLQETKREILPPREDIQEWSVHVYGPWGYDDEAGEVLEPLAEKHHGEFDGSMDQPLG